MIVRLFVLRPQLCREFQKALAISKKTPSDIMEVRSGNCTTKKKEEVIKMTIIVHTKSVERRPIERPDYTKEV